MRLNLVIANPPDSNAPHPYHVATEERRAHQATPAARDSLRGNHHWLRTQTIADRRRLELGHVPTLRLMSLAWDRLGALHGVV